MITWREVLLHNGKQLLIAVDQMLSIIICTIYKEKGYGDESLSARAWRWDRDKVRKWWRIMIDLLFIWQKDHCLESYKSEIDRMQCPPEIRQKSSEQGL